MRIRFVDEARSEFLDSIEYYETQQPNSVADSKSRLSKLYFGSLSIQKPADLDRVVTDD